MQAWEKGNERYRGDQMRALPGCSGKEGVVVDVVDHRGHIGLGVYRREEGEETVNIKQT